MIENADGFIVLAGKTGTLAELAMLWALDRAGCLGPRPVVLLGGLWEPVLERLSEAAVLDPDQRSKTRLAGTAQEAILLIDQQLGRELGE